ncbi:MAG: peptidylprolyl isomerase [Salinibacterium sp.]|nr:peptidylprolyl isomerase [Salinibacterium sp.]
MAASRSSEREAREARERLRRYNARRTVHANQLARRRRDNIVAVAGVVVIAALAAATQVFYFTAGPGVPIPAPSASEAPTAVPDAATGANVGDVPDPSLSEGRSWTGELALNDIALGIELNGVAAPQGVASFVTSAQSDYYLGKTCHRLVLNASAGLIQCGSLDGTGASDPSYSFGPIENSAVDRVYPAGTIALARGGNDAFSQGRQFFIVFQDASLPNDSAGGYTIIGRVTSGLEDLVTQIANTGIVDGLQDGAPVVPASITSLTIQ